VGLAFCKDFQIGLDLEPMAEKAKKVCHKFLSKTEKVLLDIESADEMTKVWSGKEALYKLAGRKGIIFSESLLLNKADDNLWKGIIEFTHLRKIVSLRILEINDFVLSVNDKPIRVIKK
jgi:phosphopantetheinyl transferase (holo-ACP synthase)